MVLLLASKGRQLGTHCGSLLPLKVDRVVGRVVVVMHFHDGADRTRAVGLRVPCRRLGPQHRIIGVGHITRQGCLIWQAHRIRLRSRLRRRLRLRLRRLLLRWLCPLRISTYFGVQHGHLPLSVRGCSVLLLQLPDLLLPLLLPLLLLEIEPLAAPPGLMKGELGALQLDRAEGWCARARW